MDGFDRNKADAGDPGRGGNAQVQGSGRLENEQKRHKKVMEHHSIKNSIVADRVELVTEIFEILIALLVLAGFVVSVVPLSGHVKDLLNYGSGYTFPEFLEHAFNLVIGLEFVRMLIKHTPGSALDVLVFAISRHIVLEGTNGFELLMGVAAIAGIFAIRKFLYVRSFESDDEEQDV